MKCIKIVKSSSFIAHSKINLVFVLPILTLPAHICYTIATIYAHIQWSLFGQLSNLDVKLGCPFH